MKRLVKVSNGHVEVIEAKAFHKEEELREIVKKCPEILNDLREDFKPMLIIGREFQAADSNWIDLLGIDTDGLITIIEFKRPQNPDVRRSVAQTLEYAANLWGTAYSDFEARVKHYFQSDRCDVPAFKKMSLVEAAKWLHSKSDDNDTAEFVGGEFIKNVTDNLINGQFRLIIFCDSVDARIKKAVEYLNSLSNFEIYCASAEFFMDGADLFIRPFLVTSERDESGKKQYPGKTNFEVIVNSVPPEFRDIYIGFREELLNIGGFLTMGTKGFGAYFPVNNDKFKPFEGHPEWFYTRANAGLEEYSKTIAAEALADYREKLKALPNFWEFLQKNKAWHKFTYESTKPENLQQYFRTLFDWHRKWFQGEGVIALQSRAT